MKLKKGGKLAYDLFWALVVVTFLFFINYLIFDTLYLRCLIKEFTGYDCPACGVQRAVVSLFKGEFKQAFWYNPYLALLSPGIAALYIFSLFDKGKEWFKKKSSYFVVAILGLLTIAWTIIRNLPMWKEFVELSCQ